MEIIKTILDGVFILTPSVFGDSRGWFMETYNEETLKKAGLSLHFVQDNHSFSEKEGTVRGLHYQLNPKAQSKLVRCTKGAIFDVAVDIRKHSPTYTKWVGIELSADNKKQLLVPKGFAHGFMTLIADTEVQYKVDELYSKEHDYGILWNDPALDIKWPDHVTPILAKKDEEAPLLKNARHHFGEIE